MPPASRSGSATDPDVPIADLVVRAGRLFDARTARDGLGAVLVAGDRIVASGQDVARGLDGAGVAGSTPDGAGRTPGVRREIDLPDCMLLPGLVDLHAHPGPGISRYGVDPDAEFLPRGTTTLLSQGDAGADNWRRFRDETVLAARVRIRLAINLSRRGEAGPPCFEDLADVDVDAVVGAIEEAGELAWGIAVNVNAVLTGRNDPRTILDRGLAAADATGRPILFGSRHAPDWPLEDQLARLRPGDVVTYCYHGETDRIVAGGRVLPAVRAARERGVLFDVGHGMSSFDFAVAETAIADGFPPDTISTDGYLRHVGGRPRHDLPRVVSKLLACGLPETDAFAAATTAPARVLGLAGEAGTLAPGATADLVALRWNPEAAPLRDTAGATRPGGCWEPVLTVRGGVPVA